MATNHYLHWSYEALSFGAHNRVVKPVWFTMREIVISCAPSTASFRTLVLYHGKYLRPLILLLFLPSLPFLRGTGVCGTIAMTHKGKWVPCVWWRGAVAVTRCNHGDIPRGIHLELWEGGGIYELELLPPSFCHFILLSCPFARQICRHTIDSGNKLLEECGMGTTSPLCFGFLDTMVA